MKKINKHSFRTSRTGGFVERNEHYILKFNITLQILLHSSTAFNVMATRGVKRRWGVGGGVGGGQNIFTMIDPVANPLFPILSQERSPHLHSPSVHHGRNKLRDSSA